MTRPKRPDVTLGDLVDEMARPEGRDQWSETVALEHLDQVISDVGSVVEVFKDYGDLLDLPLSRRGAQAIRQLMGLGGDRA